MIDNGTCLHSEYDQIVTPSAPQSTSTAMSSLNEISNEKNQFVSVRYKVHTTELRPGQERQGGTGLSSKRNAMKTCAVAVQWSCSVLVVREYVRVPGATRPTLEPHWIAPRRVVAVVFFHQPRCSVNKWITKFYFSSTQKEPPLNWFLFNVFLIFYTNI